MVSKITCHCIEQKCCYITTMQEFKKWESFFKNQLESHTFLEIEPALPYYVWEKDGKQKKWYATKWYKCTACGSLWEVNYPDFPANGFIRIFYDGLYDPNTLCWNKN